MFTSGFQNH